MKRYKFQAFDIGSRFSLWLGGDVGRGEVTRRLHV
jgi:hypothetical protein